MWKDSHIEPLKLLVENALQATDISCVSSLQSILSRILQSSTMDTSSVRWNYALEQMQVIAKRLKTIITLPNFSTLRRGTEQAIYAALEPLIKEAEAHDHKYAGKPSRNHIPRRWQLVALIVRCFGKRAWNLAGLQKHLESIVKLALSEVTVSSITPYLEYWLEDYRMRDQRGTGLLRCSILIYMQCLIYLINRVLAGRYTWELLLSLFMCTLVGKN